MRRGACPSLSAPMQTGDGLLARLNPRDGSLSSTQLAGVARAAGRFGNGILEISARGNLQVRGLTAASAGQLAEAVDALGIEAWSGPEIRVGALAGLDVREIADPRPLAEAIRVHVAARDPAWPLAPKFSVVVDGGGALALGDIAADIRLEAVDARHWAIGIGGLASEARLLGIGEASCAVSVAAEALMRLARHGNAARGRDLDGAALAELARPLEPAGDRTVRETGLPVGLFPLRGGQFARGVALAFGQVVARELAAFAEAAGAEREFRLAAGRGLLALGLAPDEDARLMATAGRLGMATRPDDVRLRIAACAGAPACASAHLPTRAIAREAAALLREPESLHISGCAKQCAKPAAASATLIGGAEGFEVVPASGELPALLARLARRHGASERRRRA